MNHLSPILNHPVLEKEDREAVAIYLIMTFICKCVNTVD